MPVSIDDQTLRILHRQAVAEWILGALFLVGGVAVLWLLWSDAGQDFSLVFRATVTAFAVLFAWILAHVLFSGHVVKLVADGNTGLLRIKTFGLTARREHLSSLDRINRLEMRTRDNDGEFHTVFMVLDNGDDYQVVAGNHGPGVEQEAQRILAFLRKFGRDVPLTKIQI